MKSFDTIVIGAGNGGLVAALRVLQAGKSAVVLEKHNLPGGFATSFRRGRFEFEASLHELNDYGPADNPGDVQILFKELGVADKIDWIEIPDAYRMFTISDGGYDAAMPFGVREYIDKMERYVPGSRESVERFFELAKEVHAAQAYTTEMNGVVDSKYMTSHFANFVKTGSYSVNEVLRAINMPQRAIDILEAYWCYLGVDCDRLSFLHYASMVYRYIVKKAHMPRMRSHEISLALTERIRELGGEIWFNSEVTKILTDKQHRITGVELADGARISARHIIADISPTVVYGRLLDAAAIPEMELKATNARKLAGRGFTLFLGLNKSADELNILNHNYFIYDTMDTPRQYELMKRMDTNNVQATVCLNRAHPECSPPGTTMMYFTTLFMDDVWGKVGAKDYFRKKEEYAERMISVFEGATGCKIRDSIEEYAIATPATYARYCGHPEGGVYGYEGTYVDGLTPRLLMLDEDYRIPGLRYCGGFAMRLSGYSSAYHSGDIAGRQTVGDIEKEGK